MVANLDPHGNSELKIAVRRGVVANLDPHGREETTPSNRERTGGSGGQRERVLFLLFFSVEEPFPP